MQNQIIDQRMQENLEAIEKLRLLDDDLMTLVFDKNIEVTELLLSILLQRNDLKVLEVVAQREYKNSMAGGRSIKIDIYAMDADGKIYDVEVQRADRGADAHRARFHSSMIDTKMLKEKQDFKETEGGKESVCKVFEELAEKRVLENNKAIAEKMLADGMLSVEMIAKYANLSIEVVKEIAKLRQA